MKISKKEIDGLMRFIGLTKDEEINCDECLMQIAEFVETELAGKSVCDSLKAVQHHLSLCSECQEEYEVLQKALKQMNP